MKITKVTLDNNQSQKNNYLLLQRDNHYGWLVERLSYFSTSRSAPVSHDETVGQLRKRHSGFLLSVLNKTLNLKEAKASKKGKKATEPGALQNNTLTDIFRYLLAINRKPPILEEKQLERLKGISYKALPRYLGHKFQRGVVTFAGDKSKSFHLLDLLYQALQTCSSAWAFKRALGEYQAWADDYIHHKQQQLARSLVHNKVVVEPLAEAKGVAVLSVRQQVLADLARQLKVDGQVNLEGLATRFKLAELVTQWNEVWAHYVSVPSGHEVKEDVEDHFEFKRGLKKALQTHQFLLFRAGVFDRECAEGRLLEQYSLEVSKYLALYFPLKRSGKRLSKEERCYYLSYATVSYYVANRLLNAMRLFMLQQGKLRYYQLVETVSSASLKRIKMEDAFVSQFLNVCAFASCNLQFCVDDAQQRDLTSERAFCESLSRYGRGELSLVSASQRLSQFFFHVLPAQDGRTNHFEFCQRLSSLDQFVTFVAGVRGAIQKVRNSLVHYSQNNSGKLLDTREFSRFVVAADHECQRAGAMSFVDSPLQGLLAQELSLLPWLFGEQLRSAGVFDFYPQALVCEHFSVVSLCPKPLAFIPGFRRVYRWGVVYAQDKNSGLELGWYQVRQSLNARDAARYNGLKLVYEQYFIGGFLEDVGAFSGAVTSVVEANRARALSCGQKYQWAFAEVVPFSVFVEGVPASTPIMYLEYIQSELMREETKRRAENSWEEGETGHFQQFLWQVFVKGFDDYLTRHRQRWQFINCPVDQFEGLTAVCRKKAQYEVLGVFVGQLVARGQSLTAISAQESTHIAFWTLCKLLDAPHLNELANQLSKWSQALAKHKVEPRSLQVKVIFNNKGKVVKQSPSQSQSQPQAHARLSQEMKDRVPVLQEIVRLCLLTADKVFPSFDLTHLSQNEYWQRLGVFFEAKAFEQKKQLFHQEDGTPKVFASLELARRYAVLPLLEAVFGGRFKVSLAELEEHQQLLGKVAKLADKRQRLHADWAKAVNKEAWLGEYDSDFGAKQGKVYADCCKVLDQYNWLDNKVQLVHVRRLHQLLIDFLGRMIGFLALEERDANFLSKYWSDSKQAKHCVVVFEGGEGERERCIIDRRNYIVHFEYLRGGFARKSLLDIMADVRLLVGYDRKLKNAVAKSVALLLEKHGVKGRILLDRERHVFLLDKLVPIKIRHLAGATLADKQFIESERVSQEYCDMVCALFNYR